jgi:hypothetical protein
MPLLLLSGFLLNEATEQDWTISEAFASGNLQGRNDSKGAAAYVAPLIF